MLLSPTLLFNYNNSNRCILLNCRSLSANVDLILDVITDIKPSICFFTETWLHSSDTSTTAQFPSNFTFIHRTRDNNRPGGGIGILVNNYYFIIESYKLLGSHSCESMVAVHFFECNKA